MKKTTQVFCLIIVFFFLTPLKHLNAQVNKSVRVVWLKPTDVSYSQEIVDSITSAAESVRKWWAQHNDGLTFTLNNPVVEVINGDHNADWYVNTPAGPWGSDWYWWSNARQEVRDKLGTQNQWDPNYRIFIYVSCTKPPNGSGAANYGYAVVDNQDINGLLGQSHEPVPRWHGGFAHELGHCFDLPDHTTAPSVMSASLYNYPNCTFIDSDKNTLATSSRCTGFFEGLQGGSDGPVRIFQNCDYSGYMTGFEAGNYNMSWIESRGLTNDDASSITLQSGYQVTVYQHDNFTGYSNTFTSDASCLINFTNNRGDGSNWNDDITSIRVDKANPGVVQLYADENHLGRKYGLEVGSYTMEDLNNLGIGNDQISSIEVSSGYKVTVYQHNNYQGYSWECTSSVTSLNNTNGRSDGTSWNNDISSLEVSSNTSSGNNIDFNSVSIVSFSNQDSDGTYSIQDGGSILLLENNTWKRTQNTYNVSSSTVLKFEFMSNNQGEIHGIGLDEDNSLSSNRIFRLYGSQPYGISDYNNYSSPGSYVSYQIPVGNHYTGSNMYLVFANDNDNGSGNNSYFRNVRLVESGSLRAISINNSESEQETLDDIKIYPNPVEDVMIIDSNLEEDATVEVFSVSGRMVYKSGFKTKLEINKNEIGSAGLYFVKVYSGIKLSKIDKVFVK